MGSDRPEDAAGDSGMTWRTILSFEEPEADLESFIEMTQTAPNGQRYKVVLEHVGEGWNGDYDSEGVDEDGRPDEPLLRFTAYAFLRDVDDVPDEGNWEELHNGSFCTQMTTHAPEAAKVALVKDILRELIHYGGDDAHLELFFSASDNYPNE